MNVIDKKKYKGLPKEKKPTLYGQPLHEVVRLLATGEVWARHAARGVVEAHLESLREGHLWLEARPRNRVTAAIAELQARDISLLLQVLRLDWGKSENRLKIARKLACVSYYRRTCEPAVKQERNLTFWL